MNKVYTDWSLRNILGQHGEANFSVNELNANYQERKFSFKEPEVLEGSVNTFISPNMEISTITMDLKENVVFKVSDGIERFGSTFLFNGQITSDSIFDQHRRPLVHGKHMMTYSHCYNNQFLLNKGQVSILHINYNSDFIYRSTENEFFVQDLIQRIAPGDLCVGFQLSYAPQSGYREIINAMSSNSFNGVTRQLYLEAKGFELFSLELNELLSAKKIKRFPDQVKKPDYEKLRAAYDFVENNFIEPLSLSQLALRFQLNEFKLKKGYRELYGTTVFGHVFYLRMKEAKRLLETGDFNVSEVAYIVGYSCPNNFSSAFSKMHGYQPSQLSKRIA